MQLHIIAVGKKMPSWVTTAFQEYQKRFPRDFAVQLTEIAQEKSNNQNEIVLMEREGKRMLSAIPKPSYSIALDVKGSLWNTTQLSEKLERWQTLTPTVNFFIGGPEGLSQSCLAIADERWSLSPLTFPHPMVRILLIEQLYRAWSLLNHHPYHRE